ncbi:unnamed protein product, partial [Prorocentrum cordatum]
VAAAPPRPAGAPAPAAPAAGARAPPTGAPAAAEASPRAGAPGEAAGVHGRRRPGRPPGLARGAAARAAASAEARAGSAPDGTSPCASGAAPSPRPVLAGRAGLAAEAGGGPELAGPLGGASCSASAVGTAQGGADGKRRRLGPEPQAQAPAQACGSLAAGAAEALQLPQRSAAAEELLRGWQTASSGSWAPFPPSGGWADLEPSWAAQVLGRDPPCLTLRSRALEDAQNDTAGKMHMGTMLRGADWMADGFEFGTHKLLSTAELAEDIMDAGGCAKVKTSRLHSLFQDLLHKVRYPPAAMECSWQLRRLEYETGRRLQATPEDLLGDLPERPFRLLDNSNDALATQPPRFGDHPLRAEQLRSLAWMLRREGCGGVRPEPFVVEWRRFWSPGTASLGLEEEFDTEQVTPGASVRLRRDAAGPVVDCETQQAISAWPDGEGKCVRREGLTAVVDFSDAQAMLPRSTTLTCQVQDLEFCDHGSLEVGCLVQIVPGTKAPSFGWGGVKPTSVGVLLRQDGDILTVHFATHPAWRGRRDELQRADAGIQGELWTLDFETCGCGPPTTYSAASWRTRSATARPPRASRSSTRRWRRRRRRCRKPRLAASSRPGARWWWCLRTCSSSGSGDLQVRVGRPQHPGPAATGLVAAGLPLAHLRHHEGLAPHARRGRRAGRGRRCPLLVQATLRGGGPGALRARRGGPAGRPGPRRRAVAGGPRGRHGAPAGRRRRDAQRPQGRGLRGPVAG